MRKLEELQNIVGLKGLTDEQVVLMREQYGRNEMTPPERDPIWKQYLEKFDDPIIKILLVAVVVSAIVAAIEGKGMLDTIAIVMAVMLATGIAFVNEYHSNKEFDALNSRRDEIPVKAIRHGQPVSLQAKDIVVGDVVLLEAGDAIPADGWVLLSDDMQVDDSVFTGESEPVKKEKDDSLSKGTFLTAGKGTMIAGAVGDETKMGEIAASLGFDHSIPTPLEQKLEHLAQLISKFGYVMAVGISVALFIRGLFVGEVTGFDLVTLEHVLNYFMLAVVVIVVAVPEGLPMSVALSLSLAMRKMTKVNSLVRKMIACETIGSATTICTDKTGTLTKNLMEVVEASVEKPESIVGLPKTAAEWIALNAAVNSTAYLEDREGKLITIGNSTEGALLRWIRENGIDYAAERSNYEIHHQNLFDSGRKRMSTIIEIQGKKYMLVKGAPEILSDICSIDVDLAEIAVLAARAMRTLGFAHKELDGDPTDECGLIWDGHVGIRDHLRDNVADSVERCHRAGVRVRMITGDNIETAKAIARETHILKDGIAITGKDFRELNDDKLLEIADGIEVLARAEPMDKLRLVQTLQKIGHVVAVTGDGTNDAPSLKNADVGLSMGKAGTEVAREASDIILLDDSFPTITSAIWWGRALYENIQRFLTFQLTINFGACFIAFLVPLFGYPAPFTIIQLLWINLIMDTLAALALCSEAPHEGLMKKTPIPRDARIITPYMWRSILITGGFYIVVSLLEMKYGFLGGGGHSAKESTIFYTAFVVAQIWNGINCRAVDGKMPPFFKGNPTFFAVMGAIFVLQVLITQFGGEVFNTVPLGFADWVEIIVYTASVLVVGLIVRLISKVVDANKA